MDTDLNYNTAHRCADLAAVRYIGLGSAGIVDSGKHIVDGNLSDLTVHLVEHLTLASLFGQRPNSQQLEDKHLTLLQLDGELLADLRTAEEVFGRQDGEITVLGDEFAVVFEHLGVHGVTCHVAFGGLAEFLADLILDLGEVEWGEMEAGAGVELASVSEGAGAERLREPTVGLAHETLEEFKDGAGEIEFLCTGNDIVGGEFVGNHELGQITDNLGCRGDLDNVAEQVVGLLVCLLGCGPLGSEAELMGLEDQVGQLTTWNLVLVDLWIGASEASLEWRVEETELGPVGIDGSDVANVEVGVLLGALEGSNDGTNAGLGGHSRQAVSRSINRVGTSLGTRHHGGHTGTG